MIVPSELVSIPRLTVYLHSGRNTQKNKRIRTQNFGAWNVRTLMDRENTTRPERRTALAARELGCYNIDVAAL